MQDRRLNQEVRPDLSRETSRLLTVERRKALAEFVLSSQPVLDIATVRSAFNQKELVRARGNVVVRQRAVAAGDRR